MSHFYCGILLEPPEWYPLGSEITYSHPHQPWEFVIYFALPMCLVTPMSSLLLGCEFLECGFNECGFCFCF